MKLVSVMGLIFDIHASKLYDSWHNSSRGKAMDCFLEETIPDIIDRQRHVRVLEIGCGSGNHLLLFNKLGFDINGVDASPFMIDKARKRLGDRCTLKTGLAEDLPFEDNEFDLVVFINTLEFLDNPLETLREAGRVSKKKVFFCVLNSLSIHYLWDKLNSIFIKSITRHFRPYNIWELKTLIRKAYGPVIINWKSNRPWFPFINEERSFNLNHPFGSFLGLSVEIMYQIKTDNLPLKIKVNKVKQPVTDGISSIAEYNKYKHP